MSNWTIADRTPERATLARDQFVPMILAAGARRMQMVHTGEKSLCVVTEYVGAQPARPAQQRIAEIRAKAARDLPMTMVDVATGPVFAQG